MSRSGNHLGSPATLEYSYDAADRLQAITGVNYPGVSYLYDPNGNQTTRSTARAADLFEWDKENRLTSATVHGATAAYTYRPDGLRHTKTVDGLTTTYLWDANRPIPVLLQDGSNSYLWGHGLTSATDSSGAQTYFLADGLGSSYALTDSDGAVVGTYRYDAFGSLVSVSGTASTEFRFAGEQVDDHVGFQYLRARWYDPSLGRFPSRDTVRPDRTKPQSMNRYLYVQNIPVRYVDPSGRDPEDGILFVMGVVRQGSYNSTWFVPGLPQSWAARSDEPWSMSLGRHVANAFSLLQGAGEMGFGAGVSAGGVVLCATGLGCLAGAPAAAAGSALMAHGAAVTAGAISQEGRLLAWNLSNFFQSLEGQGTDCASDRPTNSKGMEYPSYKDPRTGQDIPFPQGQLARVPKEQRGQWEWPDSLGLRSEYKEEWRRRGYPEPEGGWEQYPLHHIRPREFGGTNDFDNMVPVHYGSHPEFNRFWRDYP